VTLIVTTRSAAASLAAAVDTDLAGLVDIYASGGRTELLRRVADRERLTSIEGRRRHYAIADDRDRIIAGDIARWPDLSARLSEQGFLTLPTGAHVYARATQIAPDLKIVVARDDSRDRAMRHTLTIAFLLAGVVVVALVTIAARAAAQRLAWRVARIADALRTGEGDNVMTLAPAPPRRDEIDELAYYSGTTLARLAALIQVHRSVTDNVAHEIRTPLMHLDARLVDTYQRCTDGDARIALESARAEIRSITALLDSLLDIASSEARRGDRAGLVQVDLTEICETIAELYDGSMEEAGLTLRTDIAPDIFMLGEPMQLGRLISNLLDNAIRYVPAGGLVTLALTPGPQLDVIDDGPGIPPDRRARIFDRFVRAAQDSGVGGHGLGLALARAIAERHAMRLDLIDTAKGAHFRLAAP
ncbi:MAG: HAMP domain-containing sensor histidine kinase, partial [Sphingomonas bacterium]|nr:HAMP domain-containing sensor histidine kinase [Sphingomonas bacterium]